jgi:hypothetical protein
MLRYNEVFDTYFNRRNPDRGLRRTRFNMAKQDDDFPPQIPNAARKPVSHAGERSTVIHQEVGFVQLGLPQTVL